MEKRDVEHAVIELRSFHSKQAILCNELEALADALPMSVDSQKCLVIAKQIFPMIHKAHDFEEQTVFPLLRALPEHGRRLHNSLERLRFEHWEDESFAEELAESLREYGTSEEVQNGEKLSYMLRGFFDGLRRHMAFEAEYLLPMLEAQINRLAH